MCFKRERFFLYLTENQRHDGVDGDHAAGCEQLIHNGWQANWWTNLVGNVKNLMTYG
ncbi:hypothetical protein [Vibrio vulnificus]|uniref:hypothetical protein n=1 Tax=Vibrio vulnificus TaxID=672 RepID=UPI0019D47F98|nr:hypothetical protein [Vibrio vulnificus]MBN8092832.1 hypothetical protein [Vibrio vulnificus]HDY8050046.1 hypothetical protein [Vibrio vulnificus]HDY8054626.1 hypothetical protein [Vibrio vulnificus]